MLPTMFRYFMLLCLATCLPLQSFADSTRKTFRGRKGIIVVADSSEVRAMEPFGGAVPGGVWYANAINHCAAAFEAGTRVYSMVIPTAVAFYCPDNMRSHSNDEKQVIDFMYKSLDKGIEHIDVYTPLSQRTAEPIYARTDHHWMPLAAYYAAGEFARKAGVPFDSLCNYNRHVVRNFVGTLYRFSRMPIVKKYPEEFVYYTPKDTNYTATFVSYRLNSNRQVIGATNPETANFFKHYADGSGSAYCTFMGGDTHTVHVKTGTRNGRRLMIVKDSYGNALPGYLFGSFEEIFVVDFRFFTQKLAAYARNNRITDVLFVNNLLHAYNRTTAQALIGLAQ